MKRRKIYASKKDRHEEETLLQGQFTLYISCAVRNRRIDYLNALKRRSELEVVMDAIDCLYGCQTDFAASSDPEMELLCSLGALDNEALEQALLTLSERERKVLFARVLLERSYRELSAELGIGYKGVATIYHRARQKIKKRMEEDK